MPDDIKNWRKRKCPKCGQEYDITEIHQCGDVVDWLKEMFGIKDK